MTSWELMGFVLIPCKPEYPQTKIELLNHNWYQCFSVVIIYIPFSHFLPLLLCFMPIENHIGKKKGALLHVHISIESPAMKIRGSSEKKEFVKTADFINNILKTNWSDVKVLWIDSNVMQNFGMLGLNNCMLIFVLFNLFGSIKILH